MWFAYGLSASGVTKYDGTFWINYTINDGLISDQVNTILCDHSGNLWFGCYGFNAGISMYNGINWISYPSGSGPACNNVWTSYEDSRHNLWFGTSCHGGTSMYDFSTWTIFDTTNSEIISNNILEIKEDSSGNMWIGGYDGLSKYTPQNIGISIANSKQSVVIDQTENFIIFRLNSTEKDMQIKIFDISGCVICADAFNSTEYTFNSNGMAKGIYFYSISSPKARYNGKLLYLQ